MAVVCVLDGAERFSEDDKLGRLGALGFVVIAAFSASIC
jgi:hypothetical protein